MEPSKQIINPNNRDKKIVINHFDNGDNNERFGVEEISDNKSTRFRRMKRKMKRNGGISKRNNKDLAATVTSSQDHSYGEPLKWWEKEPIKYAFSYPLVRNRLEMLMGSNVVRLTDRRYMQKLITRIRQDYEASQQDRVKKRVTMELMRTKKMILERLIPVQEAPDELRKYPLFQLYLYCDAIIEEKQRKRMPKKVRVTNSLYQLLYPNNRNKDDEYDPNNDNDDHDDDNDQVYMKTSIVNGAQRLVPMTPEEIAAVIGEQETEKDLENGYLLTQGDYDRLYFETDAIKELKEMQSVEEMYTKAQEIVGILYSYADEGRYKKAALEKQQQQREAQQLRDEAGTVSSTSRDALVKTNVDTTTKESGAIQEEIHTGETE